MSNKTENKHIYGMDGLSSAILTKGLTSTNLQSALNAGPKPASPASPAAAAAPAAAQPATAKKP